jgi:type IV secretion system protein VirB6
MTGKTGSAGSIINDQMTQMEAVLAGVDALNVYTGDNANLKADQDRARWMAGIGVAGPMVVGGALLVMYKVGLALFVGFAPLFMMCLIFRSTHALFQKWLLYGIGTMFAQALMAAMAVLCFKVVLATATAFGAQYAIAAGMGQPQQSVSSLAMLQGGIGLLLTLLLVTVPPMAAYFFQGTLGSYVAYSMFGGGISGGGAAAAGPGPQGQPVGYGGSRLPSPRTSDGAGQAPQHPGKFSNSPQLTAPRELQQRSDTTNSDVTKPYSKDSGP